MAPNRKPTVRRKAVCAQHIEPSEIVDYVKPYFEKSSTDYGQISESLMKCSLMALEDKDLNDLVQAMHTLDFAQGEVIIEAHDVGTYMYIVKEGKVKVVPVAKDKDENSPEIILKKGSLFGELSILYEKTRNATVSAETDVTLWALHGNDYRKIRIGNRSKDRNQIMDIVKTIDIFEGLSDYQRCTIGDALEKPEVFKDGDVVIREGEKGDRFYLIVEGDAVVTVGEGDSAKEKGVLTRNDYFGELALIQKGKRKATITAKGHLKVTSMDKARFERVMGPARQLLEAAVEKYRDEGVEVSTVGSISTRQTRPDTITATDTSTTIRTMSTGGQTTITAPDTTTMITSMSTKQTDKITAPPDTTTTTGMSRKQKTNTIKATDTSTTKNRKRG